MTDICSIHVKDLLTAQEADELIKEIRKAKKQIEAEGLASSSEEAALKAAEEVSNKLKLAAIIQKRGEALNLLAKKRTLDYVQTVWKDRSAKGLEARLVGVNSKRAGSRKSIATDQAVLSKTYIAGLMQDLQEAEVLDLFSKGTVDNDVANALWNLDNPEALKAINPDAVKIAKAINKWQEVARLDANKAGAWIGKLPGYIVRQSHDQLKILKAGAPAWKDAIREKLDWAKIGADDPEAFLDATYEALASGLHMKATNLAEPSPFKGPANLAKKVSQERVLHFISADAWFAYNQQFGTGNIREAVVFGLNKMGHTTALMNGLGLNPRANLESVIDKLLEDLPLEEKIKLNNKKGKILDSFLGQLDGSARIPSDASAARIAGNIRAWKGMASLGGSVFSSLGDIGNYAAAQKYQGDTFLTGITEALGAVTKGRPKGEQERILHSLGVYFDSAIGEFTSRFSTEDAYSGLTSRMMRTFYKLNLQNYWTESLQGAAALSFSNDLARFSEKTIDQLPYDVKLYFGHHAVTPEKWDIYRKAVERIEGKEYITPEAIDKIPDEDIQRYIGDRKISLERARNELKHDFRAMTVDQMMYAVVEPDAKTRAYTLGADRPGTVAGEARRFIMQFKSFPIAILHRTIGRELFGRGAETFGEALKNRNGELYGMAKILLAMTALGYASMSIKDMLKGRQPRSPENPKVWAAAMLQGGALGIFGDLLLGEANRFGGGLLSTLAGPVLGTIRDVDELRSRMMYDDPDARDVGASAFKLLINNTPYINLFYTRPILDYFILYNIQESLNPGYLARMEQRVRTENKQEFWLRPTEAMQ